MLKHFQVIKVPTAFERGNNNWNVTANVPDRRDGKTDGTNGRTDQVTDPTDGQKR